MRVARAGGGDARGHFAEIGVGPAVDIVMEIVKLADRGEAGLQHLHVGEGSDRLHVIGRQPVEEAIHHLAPGPEAVSRRTAPLGEPSHAALEGMAMQIGKAGNGDAGDVLGAFARCALPRSKRSRRPRLPIRTSRAQPDRQQRMIEEEFTSQVALSARRRSSAPRQYAPLRIYA